MSSPSILFLQDDELLDAPVQDMPDFFADLNLDQIIDAITATRAAYDLKPFFYVSLIHVDGVAYRHEIFRDLESYALLESACLLTRRMQIMREHLEQADKLYYRHQKHAWFLDAVGIYSEAVVDFLQALVDSAPRSRGLVAFCAYLAAYVQSARFVSVSIKAKTLKAQLATIKYCVLIKADTVTVRKYGAEPDYGADVEATFSKFKSSAANDYSVKFRGTPNMNNIEAEILDLVAKLHPDVFVAIEEFMTRNMDFIDSTIARFENEIQFYISYIEFIRETTQATLSFCYPTVSDTSKEIYAQGAFDLALARRLREKTSAIVCNDFFLTGKERICVVTGANQGGKTTFARMFGQLHYLASLGCPVPGERAQLFLFDKLFTHFEREEDLETQRGKLQDDLVRMHDILSQATSNSIIVMNEIFTSTTLQDADYLSQKIMTQIVDLDLLCVWVTFIDELSTLCDQIVSMVSTVVPENPTLRTFKIVRKPADGFSYAMAIAQKYGLSYERLMERLPS